MLFFFVFFPRHLPAIILQNHHRPLQVLRSLAVTMKFTSLAFLAAASSVSAFAPLHASSSSTTTTTTSRGRAATALEYSVGIVGATGAVGKEIRSCLEDRNKLPVDVLRIFGSERSAGTTVSTKYGDVKVELFSEEAARQCDVVFLAVDGDFALAHAKNIAEGDEGAVVIDNSVRLRLVYSYFIICGQIIIWRFG